MPQEPAEERKSNLPVPDPTELTTKALLREIAMLRDVIETRLNGYDKAITLIQAEADKVPSKVDIAIMQLERLHAEKFNSIEIQFRERDTRTEQTSRDSKVAVDAALQAAKEAVGEQNKSNTAAINKMETSFTKQIDQIGMLLGTMQKSMDEKISDVKDRLTAIENRRLATDAVTQIGKNDKRDNTAMLVAIGSFVVAVVAVVVGIVRYTAGH